MERRRVAPREDSFCLWSCNLGTGWELGLPNSHLYAQQNHRLQALIEIITNETASAIGLLNTQSQQMRSAVYQNCLALDYLLAEEGGVCGKFNTSDCCLHIDDNGEAITKITQNIRKLAHVPVQKWKSITTPDWWNNLFPKEWWKKTLMILGFSLARLIFLPCLIPCFIRLITSVVQSMPLI